MGNSIEGFEHQLEEIQLGPIVVKGGHENNDNYKSRCHHSRFMEQNI